MAPEQLAYAEMPAGSAVVYLGGTIHAGGANSTDVPAAARTSATAWAGCAPRRTTTCRSRRHMWRRCRARAGALGYSVHDSIDRGGGYLGMVRMQDPVELIARGELG